MTNFQAVVIAIVEGLTEFLPVSSTGHMIITQHLLGIPSTDFLKAYMVIIQLGAILSVVVLYFKRFFQSFNFYWKLLAAFFPAAVIGLIFGDAIDAMLGDVSVVAWALVIGGVILFFFDKMMLPWKLEGREELNPEKMGFGHAVLIGLFQCIAMIPGVSRSAATIIGGMIGPFNRKQAAEFSFFLAVPTMLGATAKKGYDLYKISPQLITDHLQELLIGNAVAFVVGLIAIKTFIGILNKYGFRAFGIYRIIIGAAILLMLQWGIQLNFVD
jgi:undecaprenyl-diphosphatase